MLRRFAVLALSFAVLFSSPGCRKLAEYGESPAREGGTPRDDAGPPLPDGADASSRPHLALIDPTPARPMVHGDCRPLLLKLVGSLPSSAPVIVSVRIGSDVSPAPNAALFENDACTTLHLGESALSADSEIRLFVKHEISEPAAVAFDVEAYAGAQQELGRPKVTLQSRAPATALAAANDYSCAIVLGKVYCWGSNWTYQLGDTTRESRSEPRRVGNLTNVFAIATGPTHACAIADPSRTVYCWGSNGRGQVGASDMTTAFATPQTVSRVDGSALDGAEKIAVGEAHSCAVVADTADRQATYCWGADAQGQLGDDDATTGATPRANEVVGLDGLVVEQISSGEYHVCVLAKAANIADSPLDTYCWGTNARGESAGRASSDPLRFATLHRDVSPADELACNGRFCCTTSNGYLRCWGDDSANQLDYPFESLGNVTLLGLGRAFGCAHRGTETQCWGRNDHGQLAAGERLNTHVPVVVPWLDATTPLAGSQWHACAIKNGLVSCWGRGDAGQLGRHVIQAQPRPMEIASLARARAGGAGLGFTCVEGDTTAGAQGIYCWGLGTGKHLGVDSNASVSSAQAVTPLGVSNAIAFSSGIGHSCALVNGEVRCWGANWAGQLGRGSTSASEIADVVSLQNASPLDGVEQLGPSQGDHGCAIAGGKIYCWGYNHTGQVAAGSPGTPIPWATPVTHPLLPAGNVEYVATGNGHSCAVARGTDSTNVVCWGSNAEGQCGPNTAGFVDPHLVPTTAGAEELALGDEFSCALAAGQVLCWGRNDAGQLGSGTFSQRSESPVTVAGLPTTIAHVVAGADFACALDNGSKAWCWGANYNGQLGDGTMITSARARPVALPDTVEAEQLFAGRAHACAISKDKSLYCWGSDATGTLDPNWDPIIKEPQVIRAWGVTPSP